MTEIITPSTIQHVILYPQQAKVTRHAQLDLDAGDHHIILNGLSAQLLSDSIKVSAQPARVVRTQVTTQTELSLENSKKIKDHQNEIESIQLQLTTLDDEIVLYTEKSQFLEQLLLKQPTSLENIEMLTQYYVSQTQEILKTIRECKQTQDNLKKQWVLLDNEINLLNSQTITTSHVHVFLKTNEEQTITLQFEYHTYDASWQPHYELYVEQAPVASSLKFCAKLRQMSHEAWKDIPVTLSTATPFTHQTLPVLNPWYLQQYHPYIAHKQMDYSMEMIAESRIVSHDHKPIIDYNRNALEIKLKQQIQLPAYSEEVLVNIHDTVIETEVKHQCIISADTQVYLSVSLKHWETLDLISSGMNLYYLGENVATTRIEPSTLQEDTRFALGIDPFILVQNKPVKDYSKQSFLGQNRIISKGFEYQLTNLKDHPVLIELISQIPLSSDEKISVKLKQPESTHLNEEDGSITWEINLEPKETVSTQLAYEVTYPKQWNINL